MSPYSYRAQIIVHSQTGYLFERKLLMPYSTCLARCVLDILFMNSVWIHTGFHKIDRLCDGLGLGDIDVFGN